MRRWKSNGLVRGRSLGGVEVTPFRYFRKEGRLELLTERERQPLVAPRIERDLPPVAHGLQLVRPDALQTQQDSEHAAYTERIVAYMTKASREGKQRTSWANVNAPYEAATAQFVQALLEDRPGNAFLEDLRAAVKPIAWIGFLNSIAMAAIKLTSPGVPDIYQGNETWDFSLVDPDNRRPVDYEKRKAMLARSSTPASPTFGTSSFTIVLIVCWYSSEVASSWPMPSQVKLMIGLGSALSES